MDMKTKKTNNSGGAEMKRNIWIYSLGVIGIICMLWPVNASAGWGFYVRDGGFGFGMEFGNYDYYDRYSPDFYHETEMNFEMALSPYGDWHYISDFGGQVWIPRVSMTWRPYTYGSWSYTQYGWTWVAYEPWGWIPHHYGKWFFHPVHNWIWIPGYEWGPAWVTWGSYHGHYAWAPMPPQHCRYYDRNPWHTSRDYRNHRYNDSNNRHDRNHETHWYRDGRRGGGQSEYAWIPNDAWVVVNERNFMDDNISRVNVNSGDFANGNHEFRISTSSPEVRQVQGVTHKRIRTAEMDKVTKTVNGKRVQVIRPVRALSERSNEVNAVRKTLGVKKKTQPVNRTWQPRNQSDENPVKGSRKSVKKPNRSDIDTQQKKKSDHSVRPKHSTRDEKPQSSVRPKHTKWDEKPQSSVRPKHTTRDKKSNSTVRPKHTKWDEKADKSGKKKSVDTQKKTKQKKGKKSVNKGKQAEKHQDKTEKPNTPGPNRLYK